MREEIKKKDNVYQMLQNRIQVHKIIDVYQQYVDGTSVAAPVVSSVVVQMLDASPRLTPHEIRAILTATAQPVAGYSTEKQGAGTLNAAAAVRWALASP